MRKRPTIEDVEFFDSGDTVRCVKQCKTGIHHTEKIAFDIGDIAIVNEFFAELYHMRLGDDPCWFPCDSFEIVSRAKVLDEDVLHQKKLTILAMRQADFDGWELNRKKGFGNFRSCYQLGGTYQIANQTIPWDGFCAVLKEITESGALFILQDWREVFITNGGLLKYAPRGLSRYPARGHKIDKTLSRVSGTRISGTYGYWLGEGDEEAVPAIDRWEERTKGGYDVIKVVPADTPESALKGIVKRGGRVVVETWLADGSHRFDQTLNLIPVPAEIVNA